MMPTKSSIIALVFAVGVVGQMKSQNAAELTNKIDSLVESFDVFEAAANGDGTYTEIHSSLERGNVYELTSPQKSISIIQLALVGSWNLKQTTHHFGELGRHRFEISDGANVVLVYDLYTNSCTRWLETRHGKLSEVPADVATELMLKVTYIGDY